MRYRPAPLSADTNLLTYIFEELMRVSATLDDLADGRYVEIRYAAPVKPQEGHLAWADGTNWNPGSGAGMYEYKAGSWVKL